MRQRNVKSTDYIPVAGSWHGLWHSYKRPEDNHIPHHNNMQSNLEGPKPSPEKVILLIKYINTPALQGRHHLYYTTCMFLFKTVSLCITGVFFSVTLSTGYINKPVAGDEWLSSRATHWIIQSTDSFRKATVNYTLTCLELFHGPNQRSCVWHVTPS